MARGTKKPSILFDAILKHSEVNLLNESSSAAYFIHNGIKGDERAAALQNFLIDHLPDFLGVAKGEAADCFDNRTGQLDLIIYDKHKSSPITVKTENIIVPAEALYAVIEVKTTLTKDELAMCVNAVKKIRSLRPFKGKFVASENNGQELSKKQFRCMYIVFAFQSNLGEKDWLEKEYRRLEEVSYVNEAKLNLIDRIVVADKGIIAPPHGTGKVKQSQDDNIFLEFFLHLTNFLNTESKRRPPVDWQMYTSRMSPGWKKIKEKE